MSNTVIKNTSFFKRSRIQYTQSRYCVSGKSDAAIDMRTHLHGSIFYIAEIVHYQLLGRSLKFSNCATFKENPFALPYFLYLILWNTFFSSQNMVCNAIIPVHIESSVDRKPFVIRQPFTPWNAISFNGPIVPVEPAPKNGASGTVYELFRNHAISISIAIHHADGIVGFSVYSHSITSRCVQQKFLIRRNDRGALSSDISLWNDIDFICYPLPRAS